MLFWKFSQTGTKASGDLFNQLLEILKELLIHTSGNLGEALSWLTEVDNQHDLTREDYGIGDFIEELKSKRFIQENTTSSKASYNPSQKMEIALRRHALDQIFDQLKKSNSGKHTTRHIGRGDEKTSELKPFEFGDSLDSIALSESIKNAQINNGIDTFNLSESDLVVHEKFHQTQTSTVLMIDISHSMILYGEDRITPAKKVAMALAELITTRYPKDTLDVIVFGNDAWRIEIKDLPYLEVGPYHTNTVAGLQLALSILQRKKNANKQIMMITDGKPTCIKRGKKYYKNAWGIDKMILNRTLSLAAKARKSNIPITTFMIAKDPYLVSFVDMFTKTNNGKAFYSSPNGLGEFIFMDYKNNKRKLRGR